MLSFDNYLSDRVGLGKGQYVTFAVLSLVQFMLGFEELLPNILINILAQEWQLSEKQQAAITFSYFTGAMIGNFIVSFFADTFGRKKLLILSQLASLVSLTVNSFATQYYEVVIVVFLYGLVFGVAHPICFILASEIVPLKVRGRFMVMFQLVNICGILYLVCQCYIFLESLQVGNWKQLLRVNIIPPLLSLISLFFIEESPRFHIMNSKYKLGFQLLDQLGIMNEKNYLDITYEEKQAMILWQQQFIRGDQSKVTIMDLFRGSLLKLTFFVLSIFWIYNIVSCGIIILIPFLATKTQNQFYQMFFAYFMEVPAIFIAFFIFDNNKWGGRIKIILYGLLIMLIGQMIIVYYRLTFITLGMILVRFSFRWIWLALNALPAESYHTTYRSLGVGLAFGTGKIPGSLSSIFIIPLFYISPFLPFVFGIGFTLILFILVYNYPIDATQQPLDQFKDYQQINKNDYEKQNISIE